MKESAYTEMLEKMTKQELLEEYQKVFKEPCIDSNSRTDIIEDIKGAWRHFRERLAITKVIYNSNSWLDLDFTMRGEEMKQKELDRYLQEGSYLAELYIKQKRALLGSFLFYE